MWKHTSEANCQNFGNFGHIYFNFSNFVQKFYTLQAKLLENSCSRQEMQLLQQNTKIP